MKTTRAIFPSPPQPVATKRLLLRPIQPSDLHDLHALRTQIEVMVHTSTGKIDANLEATQIWMNRFLPPNDAITLAFAIEELDSPGTVIGTAGCHVAEPPECGYMLRKEYWGKGFATEALQQWIQSYWELPRRQVQVPDESVKGLEPDGDGIYPEVLLACTDTTNVASQAVIKKCGFKYVYDEQVPDNFGPGTVTLWCYHLERPASS